jgi:hypothetical protein
MVKCPTCQHPNEDGALFCEQCKSDLAVPAEAGAPVQPAMPPVEALAVAAPGPALFAANADVPVGEAPLVPPLAVAAPTAAGTSTLPAAPTGSATFAEPVAEAVPVVPAPPVAEAIPAATAAPVAAALPVAEAVPVAPAAPAGLPRLVVLRGLKPNVEYPLFEGDNYLGRADEEPVDIDLEDQEPPDRVWTSRQHALITWEHGTLTIEDLKSSNGTFVNRKRLPPAEKRPLQADDIIQIGNVRLKIVF